MKRLDHIDVGFYVNSQPGDPFYEFTISRKLVEEIHKDMIGDTSGIIMREVCNMIDKLIREGYMVGVDEETVI